MKYDAFFGYAEGDRSFALLRLILIEIIIVKLECLTDFGFYTRKQTLNVSFVAQNYI